MPQPRFPWPMGDKRRGGPLLGPGGPTELFAWNAETAEALPATATFTRASVAQVLTTTDGTTFWYQEAKSGELRLDGLRRVENFIIATHYDDMDAWTKVAGGAGSSPIIAASAEDPPVGSSSSVQQLTFEAGSTNSGDQSLLRSIPSGTPLGNNRVDTIYLRVTSGTVSLLIQAGSAGSFSTAIVVTTSWQRFSVGGENTSALRLVIGAQGDITGAAAVDVLVAVGGDVGPQIEKLQTGGPNIPNSVVDPNTTYNVEVSGVRSLNTTNANTVLSNVVTEATGTTITGGGYLPEPAATNLITTVDLTDASWNADGMTVTDNGVTDFGLVEYELETSLISERHRITGVPNSAAAGAGYFMAKQGTGRFITVRRGSSSADDYACFDLQTGTVTEEGVGITSALIEDFGNAIYRCSIITADSAQALQFSFSDTGTPGIADPTFTGTGETILVYHSQFEGNDFPTSPIVTAGSTLSRVADSLTDVDWPATASAVIDTTVNSVIPGGTIDNQQNMLGFGSNSAHSFVLSAPTVARIFTGGINSFITASSSYESERHGFGMSFQVNEGIVVDDEDNDNTDVTGTPGGGTIQIGLNSGLVGVPGKYHRIRIYDQTQSVEELKALV